jgi:hypothetical protein
MQKSNKKNQGFRKMAENYAGMPEPAELAPRLMVIVIGHGLRQRRLPSARLRRAEDGIAA